MAKNNSKNIHAQRMKAIRPHVDFNIDLRKKLTAAQKRKIKKYYDEFNALTARPHTPISPRNSKNKLTAARYAGQNPKLKGFNKIFIPTSGEKNVKVKFTREGNMSVETKYVRTRVIPLDLEQLMDDPAHYVQRVVSNNEASHFTVSVGERGMYEIPTAISKSRIGNFVANLIGKYSDDSKNNYYENWLYGLRAHSFHNQADVKAYLRDKSAAREKLRRSRKNERRRLKRRRK